MGKPWARLPIGVSLNYIYKLYSAPCNDKWSLMVETGLPALWKELIVLLTPDPTEILQEYLHPKLGRRGPRFPLLRTRRGEMPGTNRKYRVFGGGFPDVDEAIAHKLPGRDFFAGRTAGRLERWIWTGIDIADLVGFYWLLLGVTEDGLITWASNILHSTHCQANVTLSGSWKRFSCPVTAPEAWASGTEFWLHNEKNCDFDPAGEFGPANFLPQYGCEVNWTMVFIGRGFFLLGPARLRLFNGTDLVYDEIDGSAESLDFSEEGNVQVSASFSYAGPWTKGFLTVTAGTGSGFRCDDWLSEGQIFGGT